MKFLLIPSFLFFLFACNQQIRVPEITPSAKLTHASLYNTDSITLALSNAKPEDSIAARAKFEEAVDLIGKQDRVFMSLEAFKNSIFLYPTAKSYFELSHALIANLNYGEALQALNVSEWMNYSPASNIAYTYTIIYSRLPDSKLCSDGITRRNDSVALHYMEVAIQMGYPHPNDFLNNKDFDSLRLNNDWQFKTIYDKAIKGNAN